MLLQKYKKNPRIQDPRIKKHEIFELRIGFGNKNDANIRN